MLGRLRGRRGLGRILTGVAVLTLIAALTAWFGEAGGALSNSPSDPLFSQQWALTQADAPSSWAISTAAGVTIGIVDTGIDLGHHDLGRKVVPGGAATCMNTGGDEKLCTTGAGAGQDDNGHGSFVAGEAAALTDNGFQIAGAAPDARLVVAKVMDANGKGEISDINAGIAWVIEHGAQVVNLSLGPDTILGGGGQALTPGLEYAWSHNAVPVIASGNKNILGLFGSTGYGSVHAVVVGATGRTGQEASYSSPLDGTKWAILGPGGDGPDCTAANAASCVLSTYWVKGQPDADAYAQGTSMATPMVAGVVAQLLGMGLSPQQAVDTMLSSAVPKPGCGCSGEVDATAAVQAALAHGGHVDLVAPPPPVAAPGRPASRAAAASRGPAAPAAASSGAGASLPGTASPVENAPTIAPPNVPPPPVAVGAGASGQNALTPIKSHTVGHTHAAAKALGVAVLLAVIGAALWFGLIEPSAEI